MNLGRLIFECEALCIAKPLEASNQLPHMLHFAFRLPFAVYLGDSAVALVGESDLDLVGDLP